MENNINDKLDLYKRVLPALRCKKNELMASGIKIVKEVDIWNYNSVNNWKNAKNLTLADMVNDILNTQNEIYENYVLKKINKGDN